MKDNQIWLGVAYYPELWDEEIIDEDIRKMKEIGVNSVRIAEFAWSTMEKEEGIFDFSCFKKVVRKMAAADIGVVMCTPSATPPKWLTDKYEETMSMNDDGRRKQFGGRCHPCKTSPIMREKNRIIVQEIAKAFQNEPNIMGWQIDNEIYPYGGGCFCPLCKSGFKKWLKNKYKDIHRLHDLWGAARWSLEYKDFEDVIPPRSDTWNHPSLCADWDAYQSDIIADYVNEQADILHAYYSVPIGTDMMPIMDQNHYKTNERLDVVQFNHYEASKDISRASFWFDFMRPIKERAFWCTETQVNWNGATWAECGYRPRGNAYVNTWLPIAKGGEMNMYWHWRAHHAGHELGHGAVLSTSGRFCYNANEIKQASEDFEKCKEIFAQNKIQSNIALHLSTTSWTNFKHAPIVKDMDYVGILADVYHKALRGYNVDLIDTAHSLDGYQLLISPFLSCVDENGLKERVVRWVENGGAWIVGPMSDIMSESAIKYRNAPYSFLEEFVGVHTTFQLPIDNDILKAQWLDGSALEISKTFDGFELCGAESLATYTNEYPEGLAVIASRKIGKGKVILLGSMISAKDMLRLVEKECGLQPIKNASDNVELIQRSNIIVAVELQNEKGFVELDGRYQDVLTGAIYSGKTEILPFNVMVLQPIEK